MVGSARVTRIKPCYDVAAAAKASSHPRSQSPCITSQHDPFDQPLNIVEPGIADLWGAEDLSIGMHPYPYLYV